MVETPKCDHVAIAAESESSLPLESDFSGTDQAGAAQEADSAQSLESGFSESPKKSCCNCALVTVL